MAELNKKDVQNNKEEVPFAHYEARFRELDPEEAAQRCGVKFENGAFTVTMLGDEYVITWPEYTISADNPRAFARKNIPAQTFLLRYLLEGKKAGPWLSFKTFREMPWGELYISPYTGRVLTRAAFTFGTRVGKFAAACEEMGGARVEHGDAGYEFEPPAGVPEGRRRRGRKGGRGACRCSPGCRACPAGTCGRPACRRARSPGGGRSRARRCCRRRSSRGQQ